MTWTARPDGGPYGPVCLPRPGHSSCGMSRNPGILDTTASRTYSRDALRVSVEAALGKANLRRVPCTFFTFFS